MEAGPHLHLGHMVIGFWEESWSVQSSAGSVCNPSVTQHLVFSVHGEHAWNNTNSASNIRAACLADLSEPCMYCLMRFYSRLWGILISVSEREGLKHKETPTFKVDFPGTSGICIRIHTLWALITIPGIKAICFIKGKGGFRKIFKTFLYFSLSPFPPLFCEGFAVVLCEFIGFIIWVTEATVSVRENWLLFPNVMYLIFFRQRWPSPAPLGSYVSQKWAPQLECEKPSHTNLGFDICSKGHLK